MPVPEFGDFKMFGTGNNQTIQGAVIEGGSTGDTSIFSGSINLIGQSTSSKYHQPFVVGDVDINKINISSSEQFRGYPISVSYNFSLKCAFSESKTIPDPDPIPSDTGSIIVVEDLGDGTGFNNTVGGGSITGSGGNGDSTFPASGSYDTISISCTDNSVLGSTLSLVISTGSDNLSFPDDGLFTSITFSSSIGNTTLNYCDLHTSGAYGNGLYRYRWRSNDACDHFTTGNKIQISYDTASIDYFTDCDPAIATTPVTRTIGNIQQNQQQSCDALTISNVYFSSSDLNNGITVGDYVYTDSEGRDPFNGESKFWGINTSSAPSLNVVPDKICQIVSNGRIAAISDCTPTPPYEPDLDPASRDCNTTTANPSGVILNHTAVYSAGEYDVHQIGGTSEVTQSLLWSSYDRPNKFTLYDDSSTFDNPIYTTGWVGKSTYANAAGKDQWSVPLDTNTSGSQTIKWGSTTGRKVRVDYGYNNGTLNDVAVFSLVCTSSLQPLTVATGSSNSNACQGDLSNDIHYHFHTTGSGDFSTLLNGMAIDGIHHIGRVFEDTTGLNPVLKENGKYFSYTSSAGTRYVYTVLDNYYLGLGEDWNMGVISYHQQCPGTEIAGIHLTNQGDDCNDINTLLSNRAYIKADWSGFTISGGKLKVDNDNINIGDQFDQDLYDNTDTGTNIHPDTLTNSVVTVGDDAAGGTFLVAQNSLANPSGTKILATVDDSTTPSTIAFTPCSAPPGGGGCTRVYASIGFTDSSFSGNDPTVSMCNPSTWATFNASVDIQGLQVAAGDDFYTNSTCTGNSNYGNTYFTIYEPVQGSTFIIRMNDTDGTEIKEVWTCGVSDVETSGDNNWYLSPGRSNPQSYCFSSWATNNAVTTDAANWSSGVGNVVYKDGARFNGEGKVFHISTTSYSSISAVGGITYYFWKIDSNGVITQKLTQTCQS